MRSRFLGRSVDRALSIDFAAHLAASDDVVGAVEASLLAATR